jgi:hypothetical protein
MYRDMLLGNTIKFPRHKTTSNARRRVTRPVPNQDLINGDDKTLGRFRFAQMAHFV